MTFAPLVAALACLAPAAGATPTGPARPTLVAGNASIHGGYTKAGPKGAEWALPGGPRVVASPGAELRVIGAPQPLTLGPGLAVPGYTVLLHRGKLAIDAPDGSKSAVVLAAPRRTTAIVKSGKARAVASDKDTAIANDWGETIVSANDGAYHPLSPGMVYVASKNDTRSLVGTPSSVKGRRVLFALFGEQSLGNLSWDDVPGAAGYRVELEKSGDNTPIASLETRAPRLDQPLADLVPGAYEMRLYALDATGLEAVKPLAAPIRVVGAELPEGAYLDAHGAIRLGEGQRVKFSGVEGLEMTYGGAGHYFHAADSAGLMHDQPTLVHFRLPGTFDFATARLAPRGVSAEIRISPSWATWPKDPIAIRVRLVDKTGEQVPEWLEARPTVSLGIKKLDVDFARHGEWLDAKVEPLKGAGPWVLRVEVEDQFGAPLGRDFLEIAHKALGRQKKQGTRP
jgi:hypothetical protein